MKFFFVLLSIAIKFVISLNQLSFSGGGSFGAVEIGILKKINEMNPKKYDLYTGISSGALNAGFLSYYDKLSLGISNAERIYTTIKNNMIYELTPNTGLSLFNTLPLHKTLTEIINTMPNMPLIQTYIGATNLYSGKLDVYSFEEQDNINKVLLLMSSSAIPGFFPPVKFKNKLYGDGGILSNELIDVKHDRTFLNITFITPYEDIEYDDNNITSLQDMLCRTVKIILSNFNNPMASINQNCKIPIGVIHKYYVPANVLKGYNMLDFNNGEELVKIGYENVVSKCYNIC